MPEKNLPFFEMFFQYRPAPALAAVLTGWLVTGAVLDSQNRTIEAKLLCPQLPDPAVLRQVERELAQVYGLSAVTFHPACAQADPADAPPPPEAPAAVPPAPAPKETPSEESLSQQERLFRQTEALRQKAMAEARAAHKQAQGFSA